MRDSAPTAEVAAADSTAPTVTSIERQTPPSSPTNADTLVWRVTLIEAVCNVDATDFTVSGTTAPLTVMAVATETGVYDLTATGGNLADLDATVTLAFAAGQNIADGANNTLADTAPTQANDNTFALDNTAPTVTITDVPGASTAPFTATFTFSEAVTGFDENDITLGNATASNFTVTNTTVYTARITPTATGTVTVDVAANAAQDAVGNGNTVANRVSSTYTRNNPPTTADNSVSTTEDTEYSFLPSDFPFTDTDALDIFHSLKIVTLPALGTLTLSGKSITMMDLPQTVTAGGTGDLDNQNLKYSPPTNAHGSPLTSFTFKVNDAKDDSAAVHTMTVNVTAVNDAATGKPGITGTATVDEVLTATVGTIADPDGLPAPFLTDTNTSFQWVRVTSGTDADISGETASTYTLVAADEGQTIKVKVSFQDGDGGSVGPLTSDAYPSGATVLPDALAHCNAGNTNELWCATLTVGTIVFESVAYTGYASGTNAYGGLDPNTFTYRTATIGVRVFEYDAGFLYFEIEEDSGTTPTDGLLGSGIFTLEIGTGGDKKSFVINNPGTDKTSTFISPGLSWSAGDTVPVKLVRAPNTAPTSADSTVTATEDTDYSFLPTDFPFTDTDAGAQLSSVKIVSLPATGKGTLTFSSTAITSLPYTVLAAQIGNLKYSPPANENGAALASFTFRVNDGAEDSAMRTMTVNVTAVNDAVTGKPGIAGTARVGEVLTAAVGTIADPDGLPDPFLTDTNTSFQWVRVDSDGSSNPTDISDATAGAYTLVAADEGKKIKVKVSFQDGGGGSEGPLTSDAYPVGRDGAARRFGALQRGEHQRTLVRHPDGGHDCLRRRRSTITGYYGTGPDTYGSIDAKFVHLSHGHN